MSQTFRGGSLLALLALYLPPLMMISGVSLVSDISGLPVSVYVHDPATTTGSSPLIGAISNLGVLAWCAAMSCALLGAAQLRSANADSAEVNFLLGGAAITALLLFDDLFLLHERLYPELLKIPEEAVLAFYAICALAWLIRYLRQILTSRFVLLLAAFGFFAMSIMVDLVMAPDDGDTFPILLEDGAKLLGIASWLGFFVDAAWRRVAERLSGNDDLV